VLGIGLALTLLGAAACGGDDDSAGSKGDGGPGGSKGTTTTTVDTTAYCTAELATETAGEPAIDYANMNAEQQAQAVATFVSGTLLPKVREIEPVLPDELKDEYATLTAALEQAAGGNIAAAATPEVTAATKSVHAYDLKNCGWKSQPVTLTEYKFQGIPSTLPVGVTSFDVTNGGGEEHEMVLLRKNDGVAQSFQEILAMPRDQAMKLVTELGQAGPISTGGNDMLTADLTAGDYLALCFIPTGTTSVTAPGHGPPHFVQGMLSEFTVG